MLMTGRGREARLHYLAGTFRLLGAGDHVRCAETGVAIPLERTALLERRAAGSLCRRRRQPGRRTPRRGGPLTLPSARTLTNAP